MEKLKLLLEELDSKIENFELVNPAVSTSSVGWHIEHSFLVINVIIEGLKKSNPNDYKWKFNLKRLYFYTINKIPRGGSRAPKRVQPQNNFSLESLKNHFANTNEKLQELNNLSRNNYIEHPVMGKLNAKPAIKFLCIHTRHHIDIIDDILKKKDVINRHV